MRRMKSDNMFEKYVFNSHYEGRGRGIWLLGGLQKRGGRKKPKGRALMGLLPSAIVGIIIGNRGEKKNIPRKH